MKNCLILTLGHGSSATLITNGIIAAGYQLERITGVKGDSRFPSRCVEEIENFLSIPDDIPIFVSHWHPSGDVDCMTEKHWNREWLNKKFPNSPIYSTDQGFTHHDTHAWSAIAYNTNIREGNHIFVADGFGTLGEVISIYKYTDHKPLLIKRIYGFDSSMGLLYQFATDYVGWRQNQDEWKLNACSNEVYEDDVPNLEAVAQRIYATYLARQNHPRSLGDDDDPITNIGALSHAHHQVVELIGKEFGPDEVANIAYVLQRAIQKLVEYWLDRFDICNCTFVGGCFLNVQLNGHLAKILDESCFMPLSGDEGAGLGFYMSKNPEWYIQEDLCVGLRDLSDAVGWETDNFRVIDSGLQDLVIELLEEDKIVNVVRGTMEFGPRAYCNTSTIARPTEENRHYINMLNNRNEHMPMCPVMTSPQYNEDLDTSVELVRSIQHMIVTLEWDRPVPEEMRGVSYDNMDGKSTVRPQVVYSDHWIHPVLEHFGPLINTSFNPHGMPIVYNTRQIAHAHNYQHNFDIDGRMVTIVDVSESYTSVSNEPSQLVI